MKKLSQILIILFWISTAVQASEKLDFLTLDKETYRLYREQKWDSLIDLGTEALRQGFDYYYLRYRIGVAWYELHNYGKASRHFEKAYEFSREESSLLEYLFYSNYFLNRFSKANFYAEQLPRDKQDRLLFYSRSILKELYFEPGYVFSNDKTENPSAQMWTDSSTYLENHFAGKRMFIHSGARLQVSPRIAIYTGYSVLSAEKESDYYYYGDLQQDTIISNQFTDDYYYSYIQERKSLSSTTLQNEIYLKLDALISKSWKITGFFHYLRVSYSIDKVKYRAREAQEVSYYDKINDETHYFSYTLNDYRIRTKDTLLNDYVSGLRVNRTFSCFDVSAGVAFGRLNLRDRYSVFGNLTYYPFGNLNFYGSTSVAWYVAGSTEGQPEDNKIVFSQDIGFRLTDFMWMEADLLFGGIENTWWKDAFVVYNVPDELKYIAGTKLIILLSRDIQLNLQYQFWQKEGAAVHYYLDKNQQPMNEIITTTYQNHMITGGLKWKL